MILVGFSLLTMTTGAVAYMHGFYLGGYILTLGFVITFFGMALWLRDVVTEATIHKNFNKFLFLNERIRALINYKLNTLIYLIF